MGHNPFNIYAVACFVQAPLRAAAEKARQDGLPATAAAYEQAIDYAREVCRKVQDAAATSGLR